MQPLFATAFHAWPLNISRDLAWTLSEWKPAETEGAPQYLREPILHAYGNIFMYQSKPLMHCHLCLIIFRYCIDIQNDFGYWTDKSESTLIVAFFGSLSKCSKIISWRTGRTERGIWLWYWDAITVNQLSQLLLLLKPWLVHFWSVYLFDLINTIGNI